MDLEVIKEFLLWATILNTAFLLWWFVLYSYKKEFVKKLHRIWFDLDDKEFDSIHYKGMAYFKIGIILLNFTPYLVLLIIS